MKTKKIKYINSSLFSEGIKNGIFAVVNAQEKLNSINVFPVADGDTGTNLCLSLYPIINITNSRVSRFLARDCFLSATVRWSTFVQFSRGSTVP